MKIDIKRLKLTFQIYNFFHKKYLIHNLPLYKKYGIQKKYFSPIRSKDFSGMYETSNIHDRLDSKEELPKNPEFLKLETALQNELLSWSADGYVVLKKYFSPDYVDTVNREVERLLDAKTIKFENKNKIMFAIHHSKILLEVGAHSKMMNILELLLGKELAVFQSINFISGSEQAAHSDAISMTTFPKGNLIAIWVALEDIGEENGPLYYYPGSHRYPYIMNHDIGNESSSLLLGKKKYMVYANKIKEVLKANKAKKKYLLAKKGDVLIWHHNLIHGGEKIINPKLTRKSMVFHYYAKDAIAYHEITERPTLKRYH
jgi:phytanoyl-CoA hydroxylase